MSLPTKLFKQFDIKKIQGVSFSQFKDWLKILKLKPTYFLGIASVVLMFLLWLFGSSSKPINMEVINSDNLNEKPVEGVKSAVDPRAYWASEISNEMKELKKLLSDSLLKQSEDMKAHIESLEQRVENIEGSKAGEIELTDEDMGIRVLPADGKPVVEQNTKPLLPPRRQFGHIKRTGMNIRKNIMDYIPAGSFARGVLLTGVVVGTGTEAASKRKQVMVRLTDHAIFSKANYNEQIKEAVIIGSCEGDISSERAECRLESLSLKNRHGQIIENYAVQGWLNGEDGLPGIRGNVVDKSSDIARMALLTGMLGGMSQFFQNQATNGVFPISPITGQTNALKASDALRASGFAGTGNAFNEMSKYIIKKAEQLSPVIVVASGRVIDVVFMKGFGLKAESGKQSGELLPTPTGIDHNKERDDNLYLETSSSTNNVNSLNTSPYSSFSNQQPNAMQQKFLEGQEFGNKLTSTNTQGEF